MFDATDQALSFAAPLYPLDKILYRPGTLNLNVPKTTTPVDPTPDQVTATVPNPTGKTFFMDMQLSPDNSTWYDIGQEPFYYDPAFGLSFKRFSGTWSMTASNITFTFFANDAAYAPIYYRFIGFSKE